MANRTILAALLVVGVLAGCRGTESGNPPIHLNLNMDFQPKYDPQEASTFFADGRAMRPTVPGTVARDLLQEDSRFYRGFEADGNYVHPLPLPVTRELLERGRERYDIYCTPCHGYSGYGEGVVTTGGYGYTPAPSYHTDALRAMPDGYLYYVIAEGVRTMPPYGHQIPVADRWAIVAYIRALQRSQNADEGDVPPELLAELANRPGRIQREDAGDEEADGPTGAPGDTTASAATAGDAAAGDTAAGDTAAGDTAATE